MNEPSRWRRVIAERAAAAYSADPKVAAVILGGSVARGHADRYSDIELGVFWREPPADEDRRRAAERTGGDLVRLYPYDAAYDGWEDDLTIGRAAPDAPNSGVLLEVSHHTLASISRLIDGVTLRCDADESKHNVIAGILDAAVLYDTGIVPAWQARAAQYPRELAVAVVRRHATIDHFWRWELLLHRGENLMLVYQSFAQAEQKLLHVLLALNRVYYFGFKWLDVVADRLNVAPADLIDRLRRVYQVPPAEGAALLTALVEETYDMVEGQLPEVDVTWLRRVFRYRRPTWDEPPREFLSPVNEEKPTEH
jgi:hypothetical protein